MDSGFIISLAHFCETHGPTSILCTQLAPISCHTCHPLNTPPSECTSHPSSFANGFWEPSSPATNGAQLFSPFVSPPTSPRPAHASYNPYFAPPSNLVDQRGRGGRRGSEQNDGACESCSLFVPRSMSEKLPVGAPGSPARDGKGRNGSPVLRTTQKVIIQGRASPSLIQASTPPSSRTSPQNSFEDRHVFAQNNVRRQRASSSTISSSTNSDYSSRSRNAVKGTHAHDLTYVSLRQPSSPTVYSLLRRAILRTLSCESLPRGSSAGTMMFGDTMSGYTIAYLFRLPDPRARGSWRKYALLCLGPKDPGRVSNVMVQITQKFERIAASIITMADKVLAREVNGSAVVNGALLSPASSSSNTEILHRPSSTSTLPPNASSTTAASLSTNLSIRDPPSSSQPELSSLSPKSSKSSRSPNPKTSPKSTTSSNFSEPSSFLRARRVDAEGHPLSKREAMEAKSLTELVGRDDFFIELHASFCKILGGLVGGYRPS